MRLKKRILSLFLALSTVVSLGISSSITSYASSIGNLGDGDGLHDNTASGGNTQYNDGNVKPPPNAATLTARLMIYPESEGYRISIVDNKGNRVANTIDLVKYPPYQLFNGEHELSGVTLLQNGWFGDHYYGTNKADAFLYSNGIKTEDYISRTWKKHGVPDATVNGFTIHTQMYPLDEFEKQLNAEHYVRVQELGLEAINMPYIHIPLPTRLEGGSGIAGGAELMTIFKSPLGNIGAENTKGDTNIITMMVNMKTHRFDCTGKLNDNGLEPLFEFVDPSIQSYIGKDISQLAQLSGTSTTSSGGTKGGPASSQSGGNGSQTTGGTIKISDIIMIKGYKVIVEPLFWDVMSLWAFDNTITAQSRTETKWGDMEAICYGTQSYLSKYAYEEGIKAFGFQDVPELMKNVVYGQNWREGYMGATTLQLAFTDTDLGMTTIDKAGLTTHKHVDNQNWYNLYDLASGENYRTIGYGVHIYDKLLQASDSGTPTWDKITFPESNYKPGKSPENIIPGKPNGPEYPTDYPSEGDEYKLTSKDHQFHIIKFYAEKQPDGTYKYLENHTRDNTVHTININDEPDFKVDAWHTSQTYTPPTNPTDDYDIWKNSKAPKGDQEGSKSGRITVPASSNDTTLYIRLVRTPMLTVIKVKK